jgi:protein phosphatase methylesterase 1
MSDMAKSFARAKLASLPPEPPLSEEAEDEPYHSASSVSSTGTVRPSIINRRKIAPPKATNGASVPTWTDFFDQELYLQHTTETTKAQYHVYAVEPSRKTAEWGVRDPIIVLHHGAGSSAMTFGLFVKELRQLLPKAGILAVDAREHGETTVRNAKSGKVTTDLSIDALASDLQTMIQLVVSKLNWFKKDKAGEDELPSILLVGHSLGGAVVTHLAHSDVFTKEEGRIKKSNLIGFCVIDAVEGSAVDALKHMRAYLANKPSSFESVEDAVDWHMRTKVLRNRESARISIPSLLVPCLDESGKLSWRTDLSRTEEYWWDWFKNMSAKFLSSRGAKLLILAGTDRLDKDLMIGQMQGKFQLQVVPEAGHFVQEDSPEQTANLIADFLKRNDQAALVLPPKVSDLVAQGIKV